MDRLSINELTTYRWSFEEDVERYVEAGIPAIGVWRQKLSDFGEERGIELLADSGLAVSNLLWAGGFTGSDGRTYRDSVEDTADAIRLAGALGSPALVVYSGGRGGHTHSHAYRLFTGALEELAPLAEDENVALAIEPMHAGCATEWTFLTTLDAALEVIDAIESPNIKLVFDTFHLAQTPNVLDRIDDIASRIAVVHLGDSIAPPRREQNRCSLGAGQIPLRSVIDRLLVAGYTGYFDVELMGEDMEQTDYEQRITESRDRLQPMLNVPSSVV